MSNSTNAIVESPPIAISQAEWKIVSEILHRHAAGREVWAYGSRARRDQVKKSSDLDLIIEGPPIPRAVFLEMVEAFDESPLRFKVDIADSSSLDSNFSQRIEADKVVLIEA
jgi:uncharacterized protein